MTDTTDDPLPDHPDWFGADAERAPETDADREVPTGDWFDDPTYLDPTPGTGRGGASTTESTGSDGVAESGGPVAASRPSTGDEGAAGSSDGAAAARNTGGHARDGTWRDRTDERGDTVVRDEQGRPVRRPAEPRDREAESGGILARLKRLLGLN